MYRYDHDPDFMDDWLSHQDGEVMSVGDSGIGSWPWTENATAVPSIDTSEFEDDVPFFEDNETAEERQRQIKEMEKRLLERIRRKNEEKVIDIPDETDIEELF